MTTTSFPPRQDLNGWNLLLLLLRRRGTAPRQTGQSAHGNSRLLLCDTYSTFLKKYQTWEETQFFFFASDLNFEWP